MWISPLIVTPKKAENLKQLSNELYNLANAHGYLVKDGAASTSGYSLAGRLVASKSGRLLLEVPNALVRGVFDALHEPGAELPTKSDGQLNAHILVMDKDELAKLGGPEKITERGHYFRYTLGSIYSVKPDGWPEISKVWFLKVRSPELQKLRRTYGLSSLPNEGKRDFHIIVAVRRTNVLHENEVSKAAGVDDTISHFPEVTENVPPNEVSVPAAERIPLKVIGYYEPQMKVKRNAFLYQDPRGDPDKFATCETCHDFTGKSCENFAKGNTVKPTASCGLYRYGPNNRPKPGNETGTFTKAQAGYIEKPVRCENCAFGDIEEGKEAYCELFEHLNKEWPAVFDLDKKIEPKGCCNAFVPKGDKIKKEATLKEAVGYGLMKQAVAKANTQLIKEALGPVGWGLLSAGALASAGISAARGMRLSTPSFLDLGHQMWTTPSNRDELSRALGDVAPAVFDLAHNKPHQFRRLLSGEPVEGFAPELQEKVRTLTFSQPPKPASLGDVRITAGPPENFFKRYWNTVTGGPATHADIGDPEGNWRGLFARTSIGAPVMRGSKLLESGKYLIKPWREPVMKGGLNIRLRLRDTPPQDITEQSAKEFWKLWKKKYRFNFPMFAGAAGYEVLPEAGQVASFLPKIMTQTPGIKHILAKIMTPKTYAHLQAAGISSNKAAEICSSLIAKTLDKINPNALQRMQAQWPTPNEFLRQTGPGGIFDVKSMQLSPEMTTPEALAAQHRKKYGPLMLRAPLIAGLLGLGGYGAYRAIKSAAIHDVPVVQVKKRTSAHDVWICPHCGDEIDEKSLYRDVKGWYFHRPCFMKGKGSIRLPEKRAYSGALGSGATSGQSTDPPRLVDATGSTPAGAENQPASDALAAYDGDYDHDEFILDRVGIDRTGRITHGESTYQDSGTIQAGGKAEAPSSTGNRSYASAGFSAPEVSITPPAGQLPHLNA